jgi:hypothetical protein
MKALLIFVPFVTNVGIPPLSLALLKSCLKTSGVEASTVENILRVVKENGFTSYNTDVDIA